ncbi:hypothetical protein NY08_2809 [Rhodococcus sp. B7740]|nr:hypothetical protein NY08_2809 [Rhodococcus sp. B7740]
MHQQKPFGTFRSDGPEPISETRETRETTVIATIPVPPGMCGSGSAARRHGVHRDRHPESSATTPTVHL